LRAGLDGDYLPVGFSPPAGVPDYQVARTRALMMSQAGQMGHEDTVDSMTLFAREVMPRLQDFHSAAQLAA